MRLYLWCRVVLQPPISGPSGTGSSALFSAIRRPCAFFACSLVQSCCLDAVSEGPEHLPRDFHWHLCIVELLLFWWVLCEGLIHLICLEFMHVGCYVVASVLKLCLIFLSLRCSILFLPHQCMLCTEDRPLFNIGIADCCYAYIKQVFIIMSHRSKSQSMSGLFSLSSLRNRHIFNLRSAFQDSIHSIRFS